MNLFFNRFTASVEEQTGKSWENEGKKDDTEREVKISRRGTISYVGDMYLEGVDTRILQILDIERNVGVEPSIYRCCHVPAFRLNGNSLRVLGSSK